MQNLVIQGVLTKAIIMFLMKLKNIYWRNLKLKYIIYS